MTENGWQAIGRIARLRRERLGLRQDELADYGGPKVATVGKFERGVSTFPLRTQHQMETALGWSRTVIEQVVSSIDDGTLKAEDWEHDLVVEDVPDMGRPNVSSGDRSLDEAMDALRSVMRLIEADLIDDATRAALTAILPFISAAGARELGAGLRKSFPPEGGDGNADDNAGGSAPTRADDYALAAHDEEHSIEDEQGHDEFP